ncbi:MAG: hypothetical protein M1540_07540 [Candidatus Bathyarchaeota archaeon]|nr:hypothetical protein [Candidatus Bathyarchaeota archaeon]
MVKAALLTPAYLSVAWALMVSYQIFTQTAVTTVVDSLAVYVPVLGLWLASRIDMVIFVYAFAWVFVLSSIIPSLILGKERSVFVQFLACLTLTLMGFVVIDILAGNGFNLADPNTVMANPYTQLFSNIFFAAFYLSLPYIFMLAIDVRGKKRRKLQNERVKKLTDEYFKEKSPATSS